MTTPGSGDCPTHHPRPADATVGAAPLVARLRAAGCVFAEEEAAVLTAAADGPAQLEEWCQRRVAGEPLEHVVGAVEFAGRRFRLGPGTFVPRQRSELLVDLTVGAVTDHPTGRPVILVEMCCGVGAVGLSAAARLTRAGYRMDTHLADVDAVALRWARRNADEHGLTSVRVHRGDLWSALPDTLRGHLDVVVANAPYVPTGHLPLLPPEARLHEPRLALDGGPDGVDLHRRLVRDAVDWLRPGGALIIETSDGQATLTSSLMTSAGLTGVVDRDPERWATAVTGRRTGGQGDGRG